MKKEELVHFHILLVQFKSYCEKNSLSGNFNRYEELDISPYQVHRSKEEHKHAILVLATELAATLAAKRNPIAIKNNQNGPKRERTI